jgi:iron complex transport system substrate-binding protein
MKPGYGVQGMMRERLTLVGFIAVILVFIVGFSTLYQAISGLRGEVASLSRSVEEQGRAIEGLRSQVVAQGEALKDLDVVKRRISSIEESLRQVASVRDLERIAEELGRASAELKLLSSRLALANESLRASIRELASTVDSLSRRVEVLAEQMLFPVTVTDGVGDKVVVLRKPSRLVSLAPSVTETLYYIGALEFLVGVDEWSDFPAIVKERRDRGELAVVGFWSPRVEVIVGLKPDLVIGVASVPSHRALKSILAPYGIPVVLLPDFKLSDVEESILIVGRVTGRLVEAYETLYKFKLAVNYATLLASKVEYKPKVAAVVWVRPLFVVGGGTWEHDIVEVVGVNVYGDMKLWPQVSPESLLARAPEVIIVTSSHEFVSAEDLVNFLVEALGDAAYRIPALRDGRIYVLSGAYEDSFVRPSPRTILSLYVLLIALHPQLFDLATTAIPQKLSPETLDVIGVLSKIAPDPVVAFLKVGLGG